MAKLTLNAIGSRYGSIDALNDNSDLIEAAFENTLSRDGSGPNNMGANLDMDSHRIINLANGVNNQDAVTKTQLDVNKAEVNALVQSLSTTPYGDAGNVAYVPAGVAAVATTVQDKLRESVSVKDFGAVGDGVTDDTAAIQAAINYCTGAGSPNKPALYVPAGLYLISATLDVFGYITMEGEFKLSEIRASPSFVGTSLIKWVTNGSSFPYAYQYRFKNLILSGGALVESIISSTTATEWSNHVFESCEFKGGTIYQIRISTGAYANKFLNCIFNGQSQGAGAIAVSGTAYLWEFQNCLFTGFGSGNEGRTISLSGPIGWSFIQCRAESGGDIDSTFIRSSNARAILFEACWFERANGILVDDINSQNGYTFISNRFVLTEGYKFNSTGYITFKNNSFFQDEVRFGTAKLILEGVNNNYLESNQYDRTNSTSWRNRKILYKDKVAPLNGQFVDVVTFSRSSTPTATENVASLVAEVTVNAAYYVSGGTPRIFCEKFLVNVNALAAAVMQSVITKIASANTPGAFAITLSQKSGATSGSLTLELTSDVTSTVVAKFLQVQVEYISSNSDDDKFIIVSE